jgi:tetratricopeptide (TPR) repeat protein
MSVHGALVRLRVRLDQEITYGSKKASLKLAGEGVRLSRARRLLAEESYFLGERALIRGEFCTAIDHFKAALERNPRDGAACNDIALCLVELGCIDEALKYFERGIAVEADFATIHHNKGWLLNNIGRHREAIACFERALLLEPGRAVTYDNLADAYFQLGNTPAALEAYEKVLTLLKPGRARGMRSAIRRRMREVRAGAQ